MEMYVFATSMVVVAAIAAGLLYASVERMKEIF